MIFVDTAGWFALHVPSDANHGLATHWFTGNSEVLFTTDFVVDETLTLLRQRRQPRLALAFGNAIFHEGFALVDYLSAREVVEAWKVFRKFADKEWSFTDCTSLVVMGKLGITRASSFDHHFRQFGTVQVVP